MIGDGNVSVRRSDRGGAGRERPVVVDRRAITSNGTSNAKPNVGTSGSAWVFTSRSGGMERTVDGQNGGGYR